MTLLELVVGLTIAGFTMAAGYGALASIVDHREHAEAGMDAVARGAAHRRLLVEWLEGARLKVNQEGPPFRGMDGVHGDAPDDALTFLTTAATPLGASETVVRLYIDRDSITPERGLTAEVAIWQGVERQRVEIEPHAGGLDLRYSTRMLGSTEWLPSWVSSTVLPDGLELVLTPQQDDTLPPLLRLPITVPLRGSR